MEVSISVDFGQGYRVSLSPHDARKLYDQLRHLFETQPYASFSGNTPAPLWPLNANGSLGNGTSGALWNAAGMVTSSSISMPGEFEARLNFGTPVSDETAEKMADELASKVKAEMDKQGLTDEGIAANKTCSCMFGCTSDEVTF